MWLLLVRHFWIFFALLFLGSVSTTESNPLYRSCAVQESEAMPLVPEESVSNDPAFFASQTFSSEYVDTTYFPAYGFTHLVAMWNIVTARACDRGQISTVEFQSIRILAEDTTTKVLSVEQEVVFGNQENHERGVAEAIYKRTPWFTSGLANPQPKVTLVRDGTYWIDTQAIPKAIVHGWTTPRVEAKVGKQYFVEAVVRVTGDARLQLGMDYWKGEMSEYNGWSEGCTWSNNCQAWLSDWLGDTNGHFITWRVPVVEGNQ